MRFSLQAGKRGAGLGPTARKRDGRGLASAVRLPVRKGHSQFPFLRFPCPSSRVVTESLPTTSTTATTSA